MVKQADLVLAMHLRGDAFTEEQKAANFGYYLVVYVLETQGVAVYPGAVALVKALRARGTRVAVVSASENTHAALQAAGIAELFDACIDSHVVKDRNLAGKPAPDSYLEGTRALGVEPRQGRCCRRRPRRGGSRQRPAVRPGDRCRPPRPRQ